MNKVKINEQGWDAYTGMVGTVPFTNGISDRELTDYEIAQIGASMRIETLDTSEQVGPGVQMAASKLKSAEVIPSFAEPEKLIQPVEVEDKDVAIKYTREYLDNLAEKSGLKGVREVAEEFGVKGVQISKMIDDIMLAQQPKTNEDGNSA